MADYDISSKLNHLPVMPLPADSINLARHDYFTELNVSFATLAPVELGRQDNGRVGILHPFDGTYPVQGHIQFDR